MEHRRVIVALQQRGAHRNGVVVNRASHHARRQPCQPDESFQAEGAEISYATSDQGARWNTEPPRILTFRDAGFPTTRSGGAGFHRATRGGKRVSSRQNEDENSSRREPRRRRRLFGSHRRRVKRGEQAASSSTSAVAAATRHPLAATRNTNGRVRPARRASLRVIHSHRSRPCASRTASSSTRPRSHGRGLTSGTTSYESQSDVKVCCRCMGTDSGPRWSIIRSPGTTGSTVVDPGTGGGHGASAYSTGLRSTHLVASNAAAASGAAPPAAP